MKALFCTDGSDASWSAIEKALSLLKENYVIDIVTIIETDFLNTYVTFPHEMEEGFPQFKNAAEKLLDKTENFILEKKFTVGEKIQLIGNTAEMILELINNDKNIYNTVILGSHGKKGIKKWLGSVSSKISQKSSIPVLIIKPLKILDFKPLKVLITVDGSKSSYNAVKKSIEIIKMEDSLLEILTVKEDKRDFPAEIREDELWLKKCLEKQEEAVIEIINTTVSILTENNLKSEKITVLEGDPAEEILKYAGKNPKDLIIMSSHGREGIASLLLGSVSKAVLENTDIPVLIVHNKQTK